MEELIAQEILNILMESELYSSEEVAIEALENGPESWIHDLEERASFAALSGLYDSLKKALEAKDLERAREIREKIKQLTQND